jgi:protease-4
MMRDIKSLAYSASISGGMTMASDSLTKNIFSSFCKALFGVIGLGVGIIILVIIMSALFSKPNTVPHATNVKVLPNDNWKIETFSHDAPTILRLNINGVIGLDHLKKEDIFEQLIESQDGELKAGQVKGVIVHINSPGGTADDADAIYRLILEYKKRYKMPVIAFVEGLCASGGMYIACAADKIYATQDSLVGHVGVLMSPPFFNFSKLIDRLGIESKTLYAGKDKDAMNPFRPWKPGEDDSFQRIVNYMYERFVNIVAQSRPKLTKENLFEQGAQIYPAPQSETLGYIDQTISSFDEVLKNFATELGIHDDYQLVQLERSNFLEDLFGAKAEAFWGRSIEHRIRLPGDLPAELHGKTLYLYHPNS